MDSMLSDTTCGPWKKVTKRMVDPITFNIRTNQQHVARIEDFSYETTNLAMVHPRFQGTVHDAATTSSPTRRESPSSNRRKWQPGKLRSPGGRLSEDNGVPSLFSSPSKNTRSHNKGRQQSPAKSPGGNVASLGAFFSKSTPRPSPMEMDNQSLSSKSLSSRSVADRSHAERSTTEESLRKKAKARRGGAADNSSHSSTRANSKNRGQSEHSESSHGGRHKRRGSKESIAMQSIDESSIAEFYNESKKDSGVGKKTGNKMGHLGQFLKEKATITENTEKKDAGADDDARSTVSDSTMTSRSVAQRTNAERSKNELRLRGRKKAFPKRVKSIIKLRKKSTDDDERSLTTDDLGNDSKKLRFKEGHDAKEIPALTDSMYDDLFWGSEELADFRYEAFLEEAGLDVDEYMNM